MEKREQKKNGSPVHIRVRGARVHNLKNVDVDIPLNCIVGIAGVSGSGKSSLALGVLYAEGSRRYLESLSAYTRRRLTQAGQAAVDEVLHVPAALALHQRPPVPGIRSTFGTGTELLNSLRLMYSRLGSHRCPNGHEIRPTLNVAAEKAIFCPVCGAEVTAPAAEDLSFNSTGACPFCEGTGTVRRVDESTLVPDDSLSIEEGAVAPWQTLMWSLMKDIARENLGIRTDIPFRELSEREKDLVFHGEAKKYHLLYHNEKTNTAGEMDFTYYNAVYTVENALAKVRDEKGMKRVEKFLMTTPCPACGGTRLSEKARSSRLLGIDLGEATKMSLAGLMDWVRQVPSSLPKEMRPMAESICESFFHTAARLVDLGLSYLTLDREAASLSTGERQRMQLARAVRNRTTGVLYVLDEPSIGLHPVNLNGVKAVMDDLVRDGNSVVVVDHEPEILSHADYLVELGEGAGKEGGRVIASGPLSEVIRDPASMIGPFLQGERSLPPKGEEEESLFTDGEIFLSTGEIHTVKPLSVRFPKGKLIGVSGVSGSGKTTLILESLVPALVAKSEGRALPSHVKEIRPGGIKNVKLIDASPIGLNVRSTVATYAEVHTELRKAYAKCGEAKRRGLKAGDFSYNTGKLRCPSCDGTGQISLDVQFLPDVEIPCPDCGGSRYDRAAMEICRGEEGEAVSLPELMAMSCSEALKVCGDLPSVKRKLSLLSDLGLSYLTLGEATPGLSGGEAQRLKLASEMGRGQSESLFVFDEPTIGLHPLDVRTLLSVFETLRRAGATLIVIEHDLDVLRSCDYLVDMGPGGGEEGGRIVGACSPNKLRECPESLTGRFL